MTEKSFKDKTLILVVGVHKAATTSFYEYLTNQEEIFTPSIKELHFFTPLVYNSNVELNINKYLKYFENTTKKHILDVSPSYFYGGNVIIDEIRKYTDRVKIVLILRDPTERFISFYKQGIKTGRIKNKMSLSAYFEQCKIEHSKYLENKIHYDTFTNRGLREGCYSLYINEWLTNFKENLHVIFFEDLVKDGKEEMDIFAESANLKLNLNQVSFEAVNVSRKPRSQFLGKIKSKLFRQNESFLRKNKKLKNFLKKMYNSINTTDYKKEAYIEEKLKISEFYEQYNKKLVNILTNKAEKIKKWK
jgi:hypothetical protein